MICFQTVRSAIMAGSWLDRIVARAGAVSRSHHFDGRIPCTYTLRRQVLVLVELPAQILRHRKILHGKFIVGILAVIDRLV
jgi:hypothetical protein